MDKMAHSKMVENERINQWRFVLAGRTGSGKSTTGNTILGRPDFKAFMSASSVTSECQREVAVRNGSKYVIVDTPGLFDTRMSKMELSKEVVRCVSMSSPGPHIFLLIVNVGRFTKEEIDCFTEMFELFGENLDRYSLIVFTGKDQLQFESRSIENFISGCKELRNIIAKCNNNYIAINNRATGEELNNEIELLMQKIHSVIASNHNRHYTNEMFKEAELAFKRKEKKLKEEAEKRKQQEYDIIRAEMQVIVKAHEAENEKMKQKITSLETQRVMLEQSAKRDEAQIQLVQATIETFKDAIKGTEEKHTRMMENMQQNHEKALDRIEQNNQKQIDAMREASKTDMLAIQNFYDKMEEQHENMMRESLEVNKMLKMQIATMSEPEEEQGCIVL